MSKDVTLEEAWGLLYLYKDGQYFQLMPVPKDPSMDFARIIIWEVFDKAELSQYIEKLCWDCSEAIVPQIHFGLAPQELWPQFHLLHRQLVTFLGKKWKKDWSNF